MSDNPSSDDRRAFYDRLYASADPKDRLIAELLAAARECLEAEEARRKDLKDGAPASRYSDERIARVKAAIAKAEGR